MSAEMPHPSSDAAPCRVVLLGGNGLLGGAFRRAWGAHPGFSLMEFTRAELNLTRPDQIQTALENTDFDLLLNAAAYTQVDDAEVQPDLAMAVNAHAAGILAELCAARRARMVHFSTDYVFDGRRARPYQETDPAHPISVYGQSKLEGEQRVAAASPQHLILRLAWLFGPARDAFPEWVLQQACRNDQVRVVADKTGSPTYSEDVPGWVEALLCPDETSPAPPAAGLIHLVNGPDCTWLEYAQGVLDAAAAFGWPLRASQATPVALSSLPGLTASRPIQSALDTAKFTRLTGLAPRPWPQAMAAHLAAKPVPTSW
jgi:dTDP-4-dehydrorhamnose reductase